MSSSLKKSSSTTTKNGYRIYLIQDNTSYHKKPETYDWFTENRKFIEVFNLPPYCPELNSTERIWHYTRMQATHKRYYDTKEALCNALFLTFSTIQKNPNLINGLLTPFFRPYVVLFMRTYILRYTCERQGTLEPVGSARDRTVP